MNFRWEFFHGIAWSLPSGSYQLVTERPVTAALRLCLQVGEEHGADGGASPGWRSKNSIPSCFCVVLVDPFTIGAAGYVLHPVLIVQIPLNGFAYTGFKGLRGLPAQLPFDL